MFLFYAQTLIFAPDTGGAYSSINYEILGLILAQAHGVSSWSEFDQMSVLPDALKATGLFRHVRRRERRERGGEPSRE